MKFFQLSQYLIISSSIKNCNYGIVITSSSIQLYQNIIKFILYYFQFRLFKIIQFMDFKIYIININIIMIINIYSFQKIDLYNFYYWFWINFWNIKRMENFQLFSTNWLIIEFKTNKNILRTDVIKMVLKILKKSIEKLKIKQVKIMFN